MTVVAWLGAFGTEPVWAQAFVHPGCLNTSNDFARMKAEVQAGAHPWIDSWNILIANSHATSSYTPHPVAVLVRGNSSGCPSGENYSTAYNDAAAAYQLALRWKITGDISYANAATNILNQWANTCTNICGDSNAELAGGLYGYEFACAAEIMRTYTGWKAADFAKFQSFMVTVFYSVNHYFLTYHNGTCNTHYWANWDLCNMDSMLAIGVLCDDRSIYNEAINYFTNGIGNGAASRVLTYLHSGYLGQCQESGRDQGHCTLDPILLSVFCQIAWNQGDDLYGYDSNALLAISEYVCKYNAQPLTATVPYVGYINCEYVVQPGISSGSRGTVRPGWSMIYNHYVNTMRIAAPYTGLMAAQVSPEGGGGNYGSTSGGFDQLGFTTLTATLPPIATNAVPAPSDLMAQVRNNAVTLSWWGTAHASTYTIKRATSPVGPYTNIASVSAPAQSFTDVGLTQGTAYYYEVQASGNGVNTTNSLPVSATPNLQLSGTIIGSSGSYNGAGAAIQMLFDGYLGNFYDAADASGDWGGLDLGRSNVITQVAYCPRTGFSGRMVGGQFQGANVPDFSSGVVTLYTITTGPADTQPPTLTYETISNTNAFRYVRYIGAANASCNAAEIQFFGKPPGPTSPNAPGNLRATPGNGQATLNWTAPDGAMSFNVKRSIHSGGPYTTIATEVITTTYEDTGLNNSTTYYYVVSAANDAGESPDSTEVSVAPTPGAQTGNVVWSGAVDGTWDNSSVNWWTNLVPVVYQDGDPVLFDDTASANTTVNIPSPVSPASVTFNNSSRYYYVSGGSINSPGALTKLGSGTLLLGNANYFAGGAVLSDGTVTIQNASALGSGTVTLDGATLDNDGSITLVNNIVITGTGSAIQLASPNNLTLTGTISGNGSVTLGNDGDNTSLYLSGANTMTGGTITIANNNNYVRFTSALAGNSNADWVLNNTSDGHTTFDFATGTIAFGSLSGDGVIQGNVNGANSMNLAILVGGNNHSRRFSGIIHDNGWGTGPISLIKIGTGTQWLTGTCDYSGHTAVSNGELVVSTVFAGHGNFLVAKGAMLGVTNLSNSSALVGNLTVGSGAGLEFQNVTSTATPLIAAGNVTFNGAGTVQITSTNGLAAGNSYPLIRYSNTLSGSLTNLQLQMPYGWRGVLASSGNQIVLTNVAMVATTPAPLSIGRSNGLLQLRWPTDHTGWRLQMQTNLANTNWQDVPDANVTNFLSFPPTNNSQFFRLVYPWQ